MNITKITSEKKKLSSEQGKKIFSDCVICGQEFKVVKGGMKTCSSPCGEELREITKEKNRKH